MFQVETTTQITSTSPFIAHTTPFDNKVALRNRLAEVAIRTMREMAADNLHRMNNFQRNVKLLDRGVYYGTEYYQALKTCNQISRLDFCKKNGSFQHNLAPSEYFSRVRKSNCYAGFLPHGIYDVKRTKKASDALSSIKTGLSIIDCGDACEIAYLEAIKEVFGAVKFDAIFGGDKPLFFGSDVKGAIEDDKKQFAFIEPNVKNSEKEIEESFKEIKKGQWIFIQGLPTYKMKHFHGYGRGINVICCDETPGKPKFIGLGLPAEGATLEEIQQFLLDEYNSTPVHEDQYLSESAKEKFLETKSRKDLAVRESLQHDTKSLSQFIEEGGGKICKLFLDFKIDFIVSNLSS